MQNLNDVVRRCQQGQLDAFDSLLRHYLPMAYDLAVTILRDEMAAEDVVQDTFLAVFQKIDGYKGDAKFETWLTAIVVNRCRTRLRRRRIRQLLSLEYLTDRRLLRHHSHETELAAVVHDRQRRALLWEMVDQLEDRLRLPLILHYRYDYPCATVAQILGKKRSTIYQLLNEGRRRLEQLARQRVGRQAVVTNTAD